MWQAFALEPGAMSALGQVILIDIALAGDNAVVIGMAAAGLPHQKRAKAILIGIAGATALRIVLALATTQLLSVIGLLLAGGILLLWVCWKMWRELGGCHEDHFARLSEAEHVAKGTSRKSLGQATRQILVADVSMSLDNVLAVGGAARDHPAVLIFGLAFSIALMGLAANFIARLLHRYHWVGYIGLVVILFVALEMMYRGWLEVWPMLFGPSQAEISACGARCRNQGGLASNYWVPSFEKVS